MHAGKRNPLPLDEADRRTLALGRGLKVAVCAVVCALLTVIGMSAIEPATPVVGTMPPAASAPPLRHLG